MNALILANTTQQNEAEDLSRNETFLNRMISSAENVVHGQEKETLPDPIDYLKDTMHRRGLRNMDMKVYMGSSGNISSVLNRHKPLSLKMIRNLNKYLDIPAKILIQPYECH